MFASVAEAARLMELFSGFPLHALLLGAAGALGGRLALLVPTRQAGLVRACLRDGFRIDKPLTLMARGEYHEPRGAWFPSGFY